MRFTTVVTSKGQITIPKQVRKKIHLQPGITVDISLIEEGFIGRLLEPAKISDIPEDP